MNHTFRGRTLSMKLRVHARFVLSLPRARRICQAEMAVDEGRSVGDHYRLKASMITAMLGHSPASRHLPLPPPRLPLSPSERSRSKLVGMSHFQLSDAIAAYTTYLDHNHKLFAYLQVVAGGATAFVWTGPRDRSVILGVLFGFLVIALGNARLLWLSQTSLIKIAAAIYAYAENEAALIPADLRPVIATYQAYRLAPIMLIHAGVTLMATVAIAWRRST